MDAGTIAGRLHRSAAVIEAQVVGVDAAQARWKPEPASWSILEVVNHLADEEALDFRTRLDLTLNSPGAAWPAIDPPAWAVDRRYNERELGESLARFHEERARSLAWLGSLDDPDWARAYEHPSLGTITAGDLAASWVAHDLIHVRQLNRLHRQYLTDVLTDASPEYAGPW